jgi:hypothetical protein
VAVYRIRKCWSRGGGGSQHYYHADIDAPNAQTALRAAVEGRVQNWRHVDRYDSSDEPYESHFLVATNPWNPRKVAAPLSVGAPPRFVVDLPADKRDTWQSYLNNPAAHAAA